MKRLGVAFLRELHYFNRHGNIPREAQGLNWKRSSKQQASWEIYFTIILHAATIETLKVVCISSHADCLVPCSEYSSTKRSIHRSSGLIVAP